MKDAFGLSVYGYSDAIVGHATPRGLPDVETILIRHFSNKHACEQRILVDPAFEWLTAED